MNLEFNRGIDLLYGLDYSMRRYNNKIELYNTKNDSKVIDNFYKIYLDNKNSIEDNIDLINILDNNSYSSLVKYGIDNNIKIDYFDKYFNDIKIMEDNIIKDIKSTREYKYLNNDLVDSIKKYYGLDLGEIKIILSLFISGGFGVRINNINYVIMGVTPRGSDKSKYRVCSSNIISLFVHELSHSYVKEYLNRSKYKYSIDINDKVLSCYKDKDGYLEELLVRINEVIFSYNILGSEYLEFILDIEEKQGFNIIRDVMDIYKINNINNFSDLLKILVINRIINRDNK